MLLPPPSYPPAPASPPTLHSLFPLPAPPPILLLLHGFTPFSPSFFMFVCLGSLCSNCGMILRLVNPKIIGWYFSFIFCWYAESSHPYVSPRRQLIWPFREEGCELPLFFFFYPYKMMSGFSSFPRLPASPCTRNECKSN